VKLVFWPHFWRHKTFAGCSYFCSI
jgi:hypothetical protein